MDDTDVLESPVEVLHRCPTCTAVMCRRCGVRPVSVPMNPLSKYCSNHCSRQAAVQVNDAVIALLYKEHGINKTARKYGCSTGAVKGAIKRLGLTMRKRKEGTWDAPKA